MKKKRTIPDIIAFMISALFSPYVTALVFIITITYNSSKDIGQFLPWMVTFLLFAIVIPGLYVMWQVEIGKISDLHIANQTQRKIPFMIAALSAIVGLIILIILHAARPVIVVAVTYSTSALVVAIITQYWKISIHTALFSSIATVILVLYGAKFWWLYLLLIPLAWSRVHRKRHSLLQATAGMLVGFVLTSAVFWSFGYL